MHDAIKTVAAVATIQAPLEHQTRPAAKWAAIVDDVLVPLPRRRLKARDILAQAGHQEKKLVRDLNVPFDVGFENDAEVDLAEGNVFRTEANCLCHQKPEFTAPPKLAFFVDDAWEVTTNPHQTSSSLRGLFDLAPGLTLLRDYESPNDALIGESEELLFGDGPVFRTERRTVDVKVNNKPVTFEHRRVTGLEVKETAIKQHVNIQIGFVLYRLLPDDSLSPAIADGEHLTLEDCDSFRCVAPDDNS